MTLASLTLLVGLLSWPGFPASTLRTDDQTPPAAAGSSGPATRAGAACDLHFVIVRLRPRAGAAATYQPPEVRHARLQALAEAAGLRLDTRAGGPGLAPVFKTLYEEMDRQGKSEAELLGQRYGMSGVR